METMILDSEIPMLGDPMEMVGKDYRQFLLERPSPHNPPPGRVSRTGGNWPCVIWVRPAPRQCTDFGNGPIRCCFFDLAPESFSHFRFPGEGPIPVVCTCQGSLIE